MTDLTLLSASDLSEQIAAKKVSPVELTKAVLARAERLQPVLNCFITLAGEQALAAAQVAEKAVMDGQPLGLLHGIPFAAKDLVNTAGVRTTFGSLLHEDNVPKEDLESALEDADVIYMTRIQRERFASQEDYDRCQGQLVITPRLLDQAAETRSWGKKLIVMHPLPRINEITPEVDAMPQAKYFEQAFNGVPVRMALLSMVIGAP